MKNHYAAAGICRRYQGRKFSWFSHEEPADYGELEGMGG